MSWLSRARAARWAHFLALPLAGFDAHGGWPAIVALARGLVVASAVLAFGYLLNALADRRMDRPAKNALARTGVGADGVGLQVVALTLLALVATARAPACARTATAVCLVSGTAYSIGPRLKRWPMVGSLTNLTNFVPLMWVGAADVGVPRGLPALAAAFACMLLQNQLIHEAADREEDRAGGLRTSVIVLGPRAAALVACALGVGVALAARHVGTGAWPFALVYGAVFPVALARVGVDDARAQRLRVAHRLVSVVAGAALFLAR